MNPRLPMYRIRNAPFDINQPTSLRLAKYNHRNAGSYCGWLSFRTALNPRRRR